jgi:hypothetical protein
MKVGQCFASVWLNDRNHSSVFLYEQYRSFLTKGWKPSVEVAVVEGEDKEKNLEKKKTDIPP